MSISGDQATKRLTTLDTAWAAFKKSYAGVPDAPLLARADYCRGRFEKEPGGETCFVDPCAAALGDMVLVVGCRGQQLHGDQSRRPGL